MLSKPSESVLPDTIYFTCAYMNIRVLDYVLKPIESMTFACGPFKNQTLDSRLDWKEQHLKLENIWMKA